MKDHTLAFLVPLILAYILTPYAKRIAHRVGAIDIPKDDRRVHDKPIPSLGGLAIYLAFIGSIGLIFISKNNFIIMDTKLKGILIGATIIAVLGIIDDAKQISAKYKLLGQIIAAIVVVNSGIRIEFVTNILNKTTGISELKQLSIPVTIFWIVGITNTVNLIDGLDGLAAGVSSIAALSLAYVANANGQPQVMILLMILAGSLLGFLPYNFNPAEIFMGDTGSLLVGFILATISIEGVIKTATTIAIAIPVLALGVPIFDTTFAIIRRLVNKKPIMEADKGHLHHRLLAQGLSQKQTVLILYLVSAILGGSAIFISDTSSIMAYIVIAIIGISIFLGAHRMGLVKGSPEEKANS